VGSHQFFNLATLGDPPVQKRLEQTRLDIAQGYDRMLGSVLARLPAGSKVLLFFGKGMRESYGWPDLIPEMVRRILGEQDGTPDVTRLRSLVPQSLRRWVADRMSDTHALELMAKLWSPRADWNRTRAVCLPSDCPGFLRLNLRGREALGCVPESAREGLLEELRDGLMTFTDFDGDQCVRSVVTPEELLGPGVHIDRFPDLIVLWNSKSTLLGTGVRSSRFGEIRRQGVGTGRSGQHGPGAFALLSGGANGVTELSRNARCEDVPATILAHLGLSGIRTKGQSFLASSS
jgi:predicted AlkP superfamily phosphohydrolase/phosphomutase